MKEKPLTYFVWIVWRRSGSEGSDEYPDHEGNHSNRTHPNPDLDTLYTDKEGDGAGRKKGRMDAEEGRNERVEGRKGEGIEGKGGLTTLYI